MENTTKRISYGEYILYKNKADVILLYTAGHIVPNSTLQRLLNCSGPIENSRIVANERNALRWAFELREIPISQQENVDQFLLLFISEAAIIMSSASMLFNPDKYIKGINGNGDQPTPLVVKPYYDVYRYKEFINEYAFLPQLNVPITHKVLPEYIALSQNFINNIFLAIPTANQQKGIRVPKIIHIAEPNMTLTELKEKRASDTLSDFIGNFLSDLPDEYIGNHGKKSELVVKETIKSLRTNYPVKFVCSDYPDVRGNLGNGTARWNIAFTSPTILSLEKGDVLFVNMSSDISALNREKIPIIFDLAVYYITSILEAKGIAVILSAGGSSRYANDITDLLDYFPSNKAGNDSTMPGLIVGGVNDTLTDFTSYYSDYVTCFGKPQNTSLGNFGESSAATAYIAGLVVKMQLYYSRTAKKNKQLFLSPGKIKELLRNDSIVEVKGKRVAVPTWSSLKRKLDSLIRV